MASLSWKELDKPLKIAALAGLAGGVLGIVTAIAAQYYPVDYSAPSFSLTLIPSIFCLIGAFSLLRVRMSQDRRGILGLVTFVVSAFLLVFVIVALQLMWSGKFYG